HPSDERGRGWHFLSRMRAEVAAVQLNAVETRHSRQGVEPALHRSRSRVRTTHPLMMGFPSDWRRNNAFGAQASSLRAVHCGTGRLRPYAIISRSIQAEMGCAPPR